MSLLGHGAFRTLEYEEDNNDDDSADREVDKEAMKVSIRNNLPGYMVVNSALTTSAKKGHL